MNNEELLEDGSSIELSGRKKATILLASLGIDLGGKILQDLELSETDQTGLFEQMATMDKVSSEKVKKTITEGIQYLKGTPTLNNVKAGPGYVRTLMAASFGDRKSKEMLRRMSGNSDVLRHMSREGSGLFRFVGEEHIEEMTTILQNEHPQTVAMILAHLENDIAGPILVELPQEMQKDVIRRLGKIKTLDLETVSELEEMLRKKLGVDEGNRRGTIYGIAEAAEVLTASNKEAQDRILEQLAEEDLELSQNIERELFRFESLIRVDDRELVRVLQNVEPEVIALATRGVIENLKNKIFKNLPQRRQDLVEEETQTLPGRVLIRDVEDAQRSIIEVAQGMAEEGEVTLEFDESQYV